MSSLCSFFSSRLAWHMIPIASYERVTSVQDWVMHRLFAFIVILNIVCNTMWINDVQVWSKSTLECKQKGQQSPSHLQCIKIKIIVTEARIRSILLFNSHFFSKGNKSENLFWIRHTSRTRRKWKRSIRMVSYRKLQILFRSPPLLLISFDLHNGKIHKYCTTSVCSVHSIYSTTHGHGKLR